MKTTKTKKCCTCKKKPRMGPTNSYCNGCYAIYMRVYRQLESQRQYNRLYVRERYAASPAYREYSRKTSREWYQRNRTMVLEAGAKRRKRIREQKQGETNETTKGN